MAVTKRPAKGKAASTAPATKSKKEVENVSSKVTVEEKVKVTITKATESVDSDTTSSLLWYVVSFAIVAFALKTAYEIRLHALNQYGLIIHEFDPWFNFRATQYLLDNGYEKFFTWFDYESWYPLGRPVGTTIYPGMQFSSVGIYYLLEKIGMPMSLNDICCYVPAWYGVSASLFVGLMTYECSRSKIAAAFAVLIMAIIPAHIMRSVGGGYDNESVAVTAMTSTFYFWTRSLRNDSSWPFAFLTAFCYIYMVASWGGYVFVLNMIGIHAAVLVLLNRYTTKLFYAYTIFFFFGTLGAIQVPVVGFTPLRSLEQMGPMLVFLGFFVLQYCEIQRQKQSLDFWQLQALRFKMAVLAGIALVSVVGFVLVPMGYFGEVTARVKGLFVKHTKTGNPLVDSVAEHQPASADAYFQYLNYAQYSAIIGLVLVSVKGRQDSKFFLVLYALTAYYFSAKMVRLIIFLGPIVSSLSGVCVGYGIEWSLNQFFQDGSDDLDESTTEEIPTKKGKKVTVKKTIKESSPLDEVTKQVREVYRSVPGLRKILALCSLYIMAYFGLIFYTYSMGMAGRFSNPTVVFSAQLRSGENIVVKDYLESYEWLKANTPEDSRVMAWWDYGYQINGIANRTSIADGNTWNHEHIATLARCLISAEKDAHRMIRHLADYVLVWAGGGGDDLAKMPHIARIGTSVYPFMCPGDKNCRNLGFVDRQGTPSPQLAESLLYKLHSGGIKKDVVVDANRFENVYNSKYGKVRIWKVKNVDAKSKAWIGSEENRVCDNEGSWICRGQYPPAMEKFIKQMKRYS